MSADYSFWGFLKNKDNKTVGLRFERNKDYVDLTIEQYFHFLLHSYDNCEVNMNDKKLLNILSKEKAIIALGVPTIGFGAEISKYKGSHYEIISVEDGFVDKFLSPDEYISLYYPNCIVRMKTPCFIDAKKYSLYFEKLIYGTTIIQDLCIKSVHPLFIESGIQILFSTYYKNNVLDKSTFLIKDWFKNRGNLGKVQVYCGEKNNVIFKLNIDDNFIDGFKFPVSSFDSDKVTEITDNFYHQYGLTERGWIYLGELGVKTNYKVFDLGKAVKQSDYPPLCWDKYIISFQETPYPNSIFVHSYFSNYDYSLDLLDLDKCSSILARAISMSPVVEDVADKIEPLCGLIQNKDNISCFKTIKVNLEFYQCTSNKLEQAILSDASEVSSNLAKFVSKMNLGFSVKSIYVSCTPEGELRFGFNATLNYL